MSKRSPRLQFTDEERAAPELEKVIGKADKAADKLDKAKAKIPKKTIKRKERVVDAEGNINAMLSFVYSLLSNDCAAAAESVGLDSYVGFMHRDRPGRVSLVLDLMEELRPCMADRFVLSLVNNQVVQAKDFITAEDGAVRMTDEARSSILKSWQSRKQDAITHPFLEEKCRGDWCHICRYCC